MRVWIRQHPLCGCRIQNTYGDIEYEVVERLNYQLYLMERPGNGSKSQRVIHASGLVRMDNNVEESEWVEELVRISESHTEIVNNEVPVEPHCVDRRGLQRVHTTNHLTNLDQQ